jgi:hypothetical protein
MPTLELTDEEFKSIQASRKYEEECKERARKKEEFKNRVKTQLELDFEKSVNVFNKQVSKHIENAKKEIQAAVDLANKKGFVFQSTIFDLSDIVLDRGIWYVPKKFKKTVKNFPEDLLNENKMYTYLDSNSERYGTGWLTSSLTTRC